MQTSNQQIASSIQWTFGQISVNLLDAAGNVKPYSIKSLTEIGIPTSSIQGNEVTLKLTNAVNTWRSVDPSRYLSAHGLNSVALDEFKHDVYSFTENGEDFLIPALVLIRALMLPRRYYFEDAFNHSFLERTVQIKSLNGEVDFELFGEKACYATVKSLAYTKGLFAWFVAYPSATHMVNSIHGNARKGKIGIDLPNATLSLVVYGTKVGTTTYVHKVRLCSVVPNETALFETVNQDFSIAITRATPAHKCTDVRATESYTIPLRSDGSIEMTSDEWEMVKEEVGFSQSYLARFKYLPQDLLNSIFKKIHSGSSWRYANFEPADWRTAATVFQSMHKSGKFKAIIESLTPMRHVARGT